MKEWRVSKGKQQKDRWAHGGAVEWDFALREMTYLILSKMTLDRVQWKWLTVTVCVTVCTWQTVGSHFPLVLQYLGCNQSHEIIAHRRVSSWVVTNLIWRHKNVAVLKIHSRVGFPFSFELEHRVVTNLRILEGRCETSAMTLRRWERSIKDKER